MNRLKTISIVCIFLITGKYTFASSPEWRGLPITSVKQKEAGIAGGEGFQMVQYLQYAPSNPKTIYIVVDTSQVWKSIDEGNSWKPKSNGFKSTGGISLGVDPKNENIVFASGCLPPGGSPVDGIYRTTDGGESWDLVKQTFYAKFHSNKGFKISNKLKAPGQGEHFAFDPNSFDGKKHQTIYAATHKEGLLKTRDGGETWTSLGLEGLILRDIELKREISHVSLYIAAQSLDNESKGGLYKLIDGESIIITKLNSLPNWTRTIAVEPQSGTEKDIIYAALGPDGVYKSIDGGKTFTPKNTGLSKDCAYYRTISISPADSKVLYLKSGRQCNRPLNPYCTRNGGEKWHSPRTLNVNGLDVNPVFPGAGIGVAPHPKDPNVAMASIFSTIRKTIDGGKTWAYSGSGYMGARRGGGRTSAWFDPKNPDRMIFFFIDFGPFISEDGGASWKKLRAGGRTSSVGAVSQNSKLIITPIGFTSRAWHEQILTRSVDGGKTWKKSEGTQGDYRFISFHPQDPNIIYAGARNGSRISKDRGKTWDFIPGKSIRAVFQKNGDIVYVFEKNKAGKFTLWRSKDRGVSWEQPRFANPLPFDDVGEMDLDPKNSERLYIAAKKKGLFIFDGKKWLETARSGGIAGETFGTTIYHNVTCVVVDPTHPNIVYAGMRVGNLGHCENYIYRSTDYGKTWKNIKYNLNSYSSVWSLSVNPQNGELHMSSAHGNYRILF